MKKVLLFSILASTMLITTPLKSAEVIPIWNRWVEEKVIDMEFLKGQDEILMLMGEGPNGQIQKRDSKNGDLIYSLSQSMSTGSKFAITPDSIRFIHINGNGGSLRSIDNNFKLLQSFNVEQEENIVITYTVIAIDPIRPNAYVTTYGWDKKKNTTAPRGKVIAYNYETGEHIKDLTSYGEYDYTAIAVSPDGKYLATLNDGKAYLKIWDLNTFEQIVNEPLFDEDSIDFCEPYDIYFSRVNNNLIYFSGVFTKITESKLINGIFSFNMKDKQKNKFAKNGIYSANKLIFLDNEKRIMTTSNSRLGVLNLSEDNLEWYNKPPEDIYTTHVKYSSKYNFFIGASYNNRICKFIYDRETKVESDYEEEIIISPNPTTNYVTINLKCSEPIIDYQINNSSGILISQNTFANEDNNLRLDFTPYPSGVYFITINCNVPKTYKIIKEG